MKSLFAKVTEIGWRAFNDCIGLTDVYYAGDESEWHNVKIDINNDPLENAIIHYNAAMPEKMSELSAAAESQTKPKNESKAVTVIIITALIVVAGGITGAVIFIKKKKN